MILNAIASVMMSIVHILTAVFPAFTAPFSMTPGDTAGHWTDVYSKAHDISAIGNYIDLGFMLTVLAWMAVAFGLYAVIAVAQWVYNKIPFKAT